MPKTADVLIDTIKGGPQARGFQVDKNAIDEENRTVELAFSSETPVDRWFGDEILDHDPKSVELERLNDGGPILVDHNFTDHVGTIEKAWVDGKERVGRLLMRFGNSPRANEIFQDVIDGIRKHVSVAYRIHGMSVEERGEDEEPVSYRVTRWAPFEVSFIATPADHSIGVGRSAGNEENEIQIFDFKPKIIEERKMPDKIEPVVTTGATQAEVDAATEGARNGADAAHQKRTKEVIEAGAEYQKFGGREIASDILVQGGNLDDFNKRMISEMGKGSGATQAESSDLGLTETETREFSMLRAFNAMANPNDKRAQDAASFEFECSAEAGKKMKKEARGIIIPTDVLRSTLMAGGGQRDLSVGTATAGGHTVSTDLLTSSFIDLLRNKAYMMGPGMATVLSDLNGNIAIPRQTSGATGYWVAEAVAATESQQAFDQVTLSPNTVGGFTEYSRKLLIQSSIDVEAFVRGDLARVIALAIDAAAINGSGSGAEPEGILNTTGIGDVAGGTNGLAPTWDHIVDLETAVAVDNADIGSLRYLANAVTRGKLKKTFVDSGSNAERVWDTRAGLTPLNGYEATVTNQVPSNLTKGTSSGVCSAIVFGNMADLIIGMWGGLDVMVNPYANDTSGGVRITALQDVDLAVRHPESFAAMQDALTA